MNKFVLNETSYHGAGAIAAVPAEIKNRGFKKAFVALGIGKVISDTLGNTSDFEAGMAKVKTLFSGTYRSISSVEFPNPQLSEEISHI